MNSTLTNYIPVTSTHLGKFNTHTGHTIDLVNPSEDQIYLDDIATALSRICRFAGHSNVFFSVAQHSVLVMSLVGESFGGNELEGLLHDAPEAYLGDVISPLKHLLGAGYKTLETNFETVIAQKFGLHWDSSIKSAIKKADLKALELEHQALIIGNTAPLLAALDKADLVVNNKWAWPEKEAKRVFMAMFDAALSVRNCNHLKE